MLSRVPAQPGIILKDIETPALLIDLDVLERNILSLASEVEKTEVRIRPHAKTHKCPEIALRQIASGAVGVCCQTVGEAEVMIAGGVKDVLVCNEVVDRPKIFRLAALARRARVSVCVDHAANVKTLNEAASQENIRLDVLVEIEVGTEQCGVAPGKPVVALARQVATSSHLRFAGIHAYHGRAQHIRGYEERRRAISDAIRSAELTVRLLALNGIKCETVTGGGTGSYPFEVASGVYTEIQPGSYALMDADYAENLTENGSPFNTFGQSLFVYATVISRPVSDRAIINAGKKSLSLDSGMPKLVEFPNSKYAGAADEHGRIVLAEKDRNLAVGDKIRLVPGHCDPTVNLFDWYVCIRGDRVECVWPIAARGASI